MPKQERRSSSDSQNRSSSPVTTCIFDIFFDIPHPSASALCERAKIIEPPGRVHPDISELYDPSNISRIPKFAFPDYEESTDYVGALLSIFVCICCKDVTFELHLQYSITHFLTLSLFSFYIPSYIFEY